MTNPKPGQSLSHYRLVEEIGQGGMGIVFKALDERLGRHVALKTLPHGVTDDPERLRRFQREARAIAALNHPNIVTIHSVEESEGIHFLTMELVEGKTLDALIPPGGMALGALFDAAVPLAEALGAAHERGIVHRDLKPANVMVAQDGRVKVLDFGLAKLWKEDVGAEPGAAPTRTVTRGSGIAGTLPYMSPEQLQGREVDHRADIFSLGVILYQMATGVRPFKGDSAAEITSSILRDTPAPVIELRRDLPDLLGRIVRRCLEKDPKRRYQSALDIRNELEEVRGEAGEAAGPPGQGGAIVAGRSGGRPWLVVAGAGAVLAMAAAFIALRTSDREARPTLPPPPVPGTSGPVVPGQESARPAAGASIAILPFVNMSDDKENDYFSDGITEELINALAKVQGLKVPARTSVFALKGKPMSVQEIGRTLGVDTVLEGSVRKSGETLRITAQLINTADGYHLWSESYDRKTKDVFAIQDEITQNLVRALRVTLDPEERRAIQKTPTSDPQAFDYYLRGLKVFHLAGRRNWESARQMFSRAIEIDPKYALAHAGVADASSFLYMYADPAEPNLQQARNASARALALAPDLAEAHVSRGAALMLSKEYAEADREFETAMRLDPKLFEAPYFYARSLWAQGKLERAGEFFRQASVLRPEDYQSPALLAVIYRGLGRAADARVTEERVVAIVRRHLESDPDDVRAIYLGAGALVETGREDEGLKWCERALAVDPNDASTLYNVACIYAGHKRRDQALTLLEKALDNGFAQIDWIEHDSDLDPLRDQPRFKALLKRLKK
ncbi:MAG: hypothetical protein AUI47_07385 [Acidobacteria bacterium 13_1_40CM_2_68_5]|nr:MAG: hypothetical protein AUI47_07385 [Acidobacteria bacterium 13_1_40CM_2_68_5]